MAPFLDLIETTCGFDQNDFMTIVNNLASLLFSSSSSYKKIHSSIKAMLKNCLMHDLFCPAPKKMVEQIQILKLQYISRHVFN